MQALKCFIIKNGIVEFPNIHDETEAIKKEIYARYQKGESLAGLDPIMVHSAIGYIPKGYSW